MQQILCFGDSNTYGLIPNTTKRYSFEERWTGRLQQLLGYEDYHVVEEGLCGRTTKFTEKKRQGRNGTKMLPFLLETHHPIDKVILMLGSNDCKEEFHAEPEDIANGIEQLIIQIRLHNPKTEILVVSPIELGEHVWEERFDPAFHPHSVEVSKGLKEAYKQITEKYYCDFLAASDFARPSKEDEEHLDIPGHQMLATILYRKVKGVSSYGSCIY